MLPQRCSLLVHSILRAMGMPHLPKRNAILIANACNCPGIMCNFLCSMLKYKHKSNRFHFLFLFLLPCLAHFLQVMKPKLGCDNLLPFLLDVLPHFFWPSLDLPPSLRTLPLNSEGGSSPNIFAIFVITLCASNLEWCRTMSSSVHHTSEECFITVYTNKLSYTVNTATMVFLQIIKEQKQHIIIIAVLPPNQQSIQHHCYIPKIIISTFHHRIGKYW